MPAKVGIHGYHRDISDVDLARVMPTKVGIHGFAACGKANRGWRDFARHRDERRG